MLIKNTVIIKYKNMDCMTSQLLKVT
uniref:Uncharacterized protein n=1 Tax=Anguilla anguilla TaxID=7936 RepID=A0A0E9VEK1_ANGAN